MNFIINCRYRNQSLQIINPTSYTTPLRIRNQRTRLVNKHHTETKLNNHIRLSGFTTLSKPSIFKARHSLSKSPNSPLGQPFLSNHSKYSSGKSIKTLPAYLPKGICILASFIRFSFSNINRIVVIVSRIRVPPAQSPDQFHTALC